MREHNAELSGFHRQFEVKLGRDSELRPARRAPDLRPSRVGVRASPKAAMGQADFRRDEHLVFRVVVFPSLDKRVI